MEKEKKSAFSVNLSLTDEDLLRLKKIILDFVKEKAETAVVSYYRPGAHSVVAGGLKLEGAFLIEGPEEDDLNKVLDLIKKAQGREPDKKTQTMITIALPIIDTPTGKKE